MIEKVKDLIPANIYNELPSVVEKYLINTPVRLAHFCSQCAHESTNFTRLHENLNYSADGLMKIFPKYFPTIESTINYARCPEKISNRIYSSRMGNGDEASGDGYKFRGRGAIQLTGKSNYHDFDGVVVEDIVSNPDLVETKYPLFSAGYFWNKHSINLVADGGATDDDVKKITKIINGGYTGLSERTELFHKFYSKLSA